MGVRFPLPAADLLDKMLSAIILLTIIMRYI